MIVSEEFIINGFPLLLVVGTGFFDGVVIQRGKIQPSKMKTAAFSEAMKIALAGLPLLEKWQEVKHWCESVKSELGLSVFRRHYVEDAIHELKKLRSIKSDFIFYGEIDEYLAFFEDVLKNPPQPPAKTRKVVSGYVYLLKSENGHYKIGKTKNPQNRIKTFGVKLPFHVEYICLIQTDDMEVLEIELHTQYKTKRINGEWFDLSPEDVAYIKSLAEVQS